MDEAEAREILKPKRWPKNLMGNGLWPMGEEYPIWYTHEPDKAFLAGTYTLEQLKALVWWMENK